MVFGFDRQRRHRCAAALAAALMIAGGAGAPAASAAPTSSTTATASVRAAVLTMTVWESGNDLMSQGTLTSSKDGSAIAGQTVNLQVDGQTKATGTTDTTGAWQAQVSLDQISDGSHTIGAQFTGSTTDGAAQVQTQMTTRKPQSPTVLTGALNTAVAAPGQEVHAQGTLQSNGQAVANAAVQLNFGGVTNQATTDSNGSYDIKATVPTSATIGSTLTAALTFPGDQTHPSASLNLPLMVRRVASQSASASPSATASPSPTPSATPTPSSSPTPGSLVTTTSASATPTSTQGIQLPTLGIGALLPFAVVGLLALAAAGGLGYWLYLHRGDPDPDE